VHGDAIRRYVGVQNVSEMDRTNTFTIEDNPELWKLAEDCAKLYNEVNFERRQAYIHYKPIKWYPKQLYEKYASIIGSATAQQIINKNNEAWKSFLALKRLEAKGKLPKHITRVSMPRYWKKNGRRELRIIVRNDCYRIDDKHIYLPKGLKLKYKGILKWKGKPGRLEIVYDEVDKMWRGFMTVKVEKPPIRGGKPLYIDLGIVNLATIWFKGLKQPIAFSGKSILSDWWYWTRKIAKEQSRLAEVNGVKVSRRLKKLYRIRQRRFKHAVNAMIKTIVEDAYQLGISKIILGRLKGVRNKSRNNSRANAMINNFWNFNYIVKRFKEKAEEYGIEVEEKSEYKTSSRCPLCRSEEIMTRGRLFKCLSCGLEANRDTVGALNIGHLHGGGVNRVVAHPKLLRWNGMRWKPKRAMNNQPMTTLEAKISTSEVVESVNPYTIIRRKGLPQYQATAWLTV
jgi:putative transposase